MTKYLLMLFVVTFNVCGHVFLKAGMNQIGGIGIGALVSNFSKIFSNYSILFGLFCYITSVGGYMVLLSKIDISIAYPIVTSLAYGAIVLVSFFIFKEPFSAIKWVGLGLILGGVLLVGMK
jgi:multidrug transporter EmrE-like cation transporter